MSTRLFIAALLIAVGITASRAQLSMLGIGPADNGTPIAACGAGAINLSQGCTLPIALGLIP